MGASAVQRHLNTVEVPGSHVSLIWPLWDNCPHMGLPPLLPPSWPGSVRAMVGNRDSCYLVYMLGICTACDYILVLDRQGRVERASLDTWQS